MTDQKTKERRRALVRERLNDDELKAVGEVAVRCAILDHMLEITVDQIAKRYPSSFRDRLVKLQVETMIDGIGEHLAARMPEHRAGIEAMMGEIKTVRARRHDIMHRVWMNSDDPDKKMLVEPRSWKKKPGVEISVGDMWNLADQVIDLFYELGDWKMLAVKKEMAERGETIDLMAPR